MEAYSNNLSYESGRGYALAWVENIAKIKNK